MYVPVFRDDVDGVVAADEKGGLDFTITALNARETDIRIAFGNSRETQSRREFKFQYNAPISPRALPLSIPGILSETIFWSDHFYHFHDCDDLTLEISLPKGAKFIKSNPPININKSLGPFRFEAGRMLALDRYTFHLAFKVNKAMWVRLCQLGKWLGAIIVTAIVGFIITEIIKRTKGGH
jgi:hypothetical protein